MTLTQPANRRFPRTGKRYVRLGETQGKPRPSAWGKRSVCLGFETLRTGKPSVGFVRGNRRIPQAVPHAVPKFSPYRLRQKLLVKFSSPYGETGPFPKKTPREPRTNPVRSPPRLWRLYIAYSFPRTGNSPFSPSVPQPFPRTNPHLSPTWQ